jgi:hypothetical protein
VCGFCGVCCNACGSCSPAAPPFPHVVTTPRRLLCSLTSCRVNVCRAAALAAQNLVVQKQADKAVALVTAAIVDTRANELLFTNMRYHIAKYFGYVIPTKRLVGWMCDQYKGCKCVGGDGCAFGRLLRSPSSVALACAASATAATAVACRSCCCSLLLLLLLLSPLLAVFYFVGPPWSSPPLAHLLSRCLRSAGA